MFNSSRNLRYVFWNQWDNENDYIYHDCRDGGNILTYPKVYKVDVPCYSMVEDDGKPKDASVPQGKETDTPVETSDKPLTDAEKVSKDRLALKEENDKFEAEKLRSEKLRAEKSLGGQTGAEIEPKTLDQKAAEEAKEIVDAFN